MAQEAMKSVQITNRDATPSVFINPGVGGSGNVRHKIGFLASVTANANTTSTIRMLDVSAHCVITSLQFASAAQTAGQFDIGVYRTPADGGAAVDQDFFASGVVVTNAVALTDVLNESGINTNTKQGQLLWQAVGMTEPTPGTRLDLVLTVVGTAITTGTGEVILKCEYAR